MSQGDAILGRKCTRCTLVLNINVDRFNLDSICISYHLLIFAFLAIAWLHHSPKFEMSVAGALCVQL